MSKRDKFESFEQLLENEVCFDPKELLNSLSQSMSRAEKIKHLAWISDVEDWRFKINEQGEIYDSETDDGE